MTVAKRNGVLLSTISKINGMLKSGISKIDGQGLFSYISNGNICDEDMADITDWIDSDSGTGVSSQATFDGKSTMQLATGGTIGGIASRARDVGTFGARTVLSLELYLNAIGALAQTDYFRLDIYDGTTLIYIMFANDGLFVFDGAASNEVGVNLVATGAWQEWTFDINWTAQTMDVYLNKVLQVSGVDISYSSGGTNGIILISVYSYTTANRSAYVNWFKAGSGFA